MKKIIISSILASMLTVSTASAFDDQREGFLVGIGAGASIVNTSLDVYDSYYGSFSSDESSFGLATSFKLGYGFNNQFLLYYTNDVSWFGLKGTNDTFITGGSSIGAMYYIDENSPIYLVGAIGIGSFSNFTNGGGETGSTFSIGGGYEVSPHVLLEATYQHVNVEDYYNDGYNYGSADVSTNSFRFTINYMWY